MSAFLEKISSNGYKITPQRELILKIMEESNIPLTAEAITGEIRKEKPNISLATVYRNLNLMVEMRLVNKFYAGSEPALYELSDEHKHHHHMTCLNCGKVINLAICPLKKEIDDIARQYNFMVKDHYFEIIGYCSQCKIKDDRGARL